MVRRVLVVAALVATSTFTAGTATAQPPIRGFDSCAAIRAAVPIAADGNYQLNTGSHLVPVYCHDMDGTPLEYVTLTTPNHSQYTAGGAASGTDVRTTFTKVRIDPSTLTVDINDLTFASSTGTARQGSTVITSLPYGVGASCDSRPSGTARIDLSGTAFQLADTFVLSGYRPVGAATISADNRSADLRGGGYCGSIIPAPWIYAPVNPAQPDFHLELACGPYRFIDLLLGRACAALR